MYPERAFGIIRAGSLKERSPSSCLTSTVKALKKTQNTNGNHIKTTHWKKTFLNLRVDYHYTTTVLWHSGGFCPGWPGWAGTRKAHACVHACTRICVRILSSERCFLLLLLLLLLLHPFNGFFSRTIWVNRHQKGKPFWILMKQEMMGWQCHQLDHMQIICTPLQTGNHASTMPLSLYRPNVLPAAQPTA